MRFASYITNMRAKRAENVETSPPPPSEKRTDAPAYGMALYGHYTDKTLKLREIYEYASELNFFDIFTI